jgi:hypothetical protein
MFFMNHVRRRVNAVYRIENESLTAWRTRMIFMNHVLRRELIYRIESESLTVWRTRMIL